MDLLWGPEPIQQFTQLVVMIDDAFEQGWITRFYYDDLYHQLEREWFWYRRERIEATAKATTDLQRLALDNQNVHTKEVNQQTSDAQKYLLETSVPNGQMTVDEIWSAWSGKDTKQRKKVVKDIEKWYETADCVKQNDWLYKRMLDGLWARIKVHKEKDELLQRLWEEASESVKMCCQGHLSRLANVLVGFTDEVKAEIPVGEILQNKIALIAGLDVSVEHKVGEAWAVFEELNIPMEERQTWIEAF